LFLIDATEETGAPSYWTNGTDPFGASWFVKVSDSAALKKMVVTNMFHLRKALTASTFGKQFMKPRGLKLETLAWALKVVS